MHITRSIFAALFAHVSSDSPLISNVLRLWAIMSPSRTGTCTSAMFSESSERMDLSNAAFGAILSGSMGDFSVNKYLMNFCFLIRDVKKSPSSQ